MATTNMGKIDFAKKLGFALTCKLNLAFAAHDAMLDDRYGDALESLKSEGKLQLAGELRAMWSLPG